MNPILRMFMDSGDGPLWISSDDEVGPVEAADLRLSRPTQEELRSWVAFWKDHFDDSVDARSWDSGASKDAWIVQGEHLRSKIQTEVGDGIRVIFDLVTVGE